MAGYSYGHGFTDYLDGIIQDGGTGLQDDRESQAAGNMSHAMNDEMLSSGLAADQEAYAMSTSGEEGEAEAEENEQQAGEEEGEQQPEVDERRAGDMVKMGSAKGKGGAAGSAGGIITLGVIIARYKAIKATKIGKQAIAMMNKMLKKKIGIVLAKGTVATIGILALPALGVGMMVATADDLVLQILQFAASGIGIAIGLTLIVNAVLLFPKIQVLLQKADKMIRPATAAAQKAGA